MASALSLDQLGIRKFGESLGHRVKRVIRITAADLSLYMENYLKELLENAGWYEGREIDTDYIVEELKREGMFSPSDEVLKLLREFWNINIGFKYFNGLCGNIRLNTEAACEVEENVIKKICIFLKEELIPVGFINEDSAQLLVSNSGKFYMAHDKKGYKIGSNFFDALAAIILQKDILRVW